MMNTTRRYRKSLFLCLIFNFIAASSLYAFQDQRSNSGEILDQIEKGIVEGKFDAFSGYLGPQVSISMSGDRSGRYSTNQAFSIMKNFFGMRETLSFAFTTRQETENSAYATGGGRFIKRGTKESVQVYVVLKNTGGKWIITQIHLY